MPRSGPSFALAAIAASPEPVHEGHDERDNRNTPQCGKRIHHDSFAPASHIAMDTQVTHNPIAKPVSSQENGLSLIT